MQKIIIFILFFGFTLQLSSQSSTALSDYRRSSLYSILIQHPEKDFYKQLAEVFYEMPVPDKFDDHNLNIRVLNYSNLQGTTADNKSIELFSDDVDPYQIVDLESTALKTEQTKELVANWLYGNGVARRMVAKWFDRDKADGSFNMNLIAQRGLYDASAIDVAVARESVRGRHLLADAGEELIGNSFIVVNDIMYIDKEEQAQKVKKGLNIATSVLSYVPGGGNIKQIANIAQGATMVGSLVAGSIAGFTVKITTHLYRLDWDEETANLFYQSYYYDNQSLDPTRKEAFEQDLSMFKLTYVGSTEARSAKTTMRGVHRPEDIIRKVCTRAIDNNILTLQRSYDVFKIKTPLTGASPIQAPVGVKEGVSDKSQFEVLERTEDANGRTSYRRVGVIAPVRGKIWDNTYMATEEGFANANLSATEFRQVSGGPFAPGMLIREISF